jgi:hypothetical protein
VTKKGRKIEMSYAYQEQEQKKKIKLIKMCLYVINNIDELCRTDECKEKIDELAKDGSSIDGIKIGLFDEKISIMLCKIGVEDETIQHQIREKLLDLYRNFLKPSEISFEERLNIFERELLDADLVLSTQLRLPRTFRKFIKMCVYVMKNIEELPQAPDGQNIAGDYSDEVKLELFKVKLPVMFEKLRIRDSSIQTELTRAIPHLYSQFLEENLHKNYSIEEKENRFLHQLNCFAELVLIESSK